MPSRRFDGDYTRARNQPSKQRAEPASIPANRRARCQFGRDVVSAQSRTGIQKLADFVFRLSEEKGFLEKIGMQLDRARMEHCRGEPSYSTVRKSGRNAKPVESRAHGKGWSCPISGDSERGTISVESERIRQGRHGRSERSRCSILNR